MQKLSLPVTLIFLFSLLKFVNSSRTVAHTLSIMLNYEHFKSCEVIFVTTSSGNLDSFDKPTLPDIHSAVLSNYNPTVSSSGTFTVRNGRSPQNNKTITVKYKRLNDIHRFNNKHCGVAVICISHSAPGLSKWLFDTIIPRYVPIIRKDEDVFLFVFNSESDADEMLLSHDFGRKIKFKVGIVVPLREKTEPKIKQVDLYGQNGDGSVNTVETFPIIGVKSLLADKSNFNGKRLSVVNPKSASYFEMQPEGNGYRPVRGLYKVWLDVMRERFNFTIHLSLSSASGSTGKRLKNGTWVGSVGDILNGRADMASFNGHIYNRHEYVDWSAPLTYEWMVFITHKPKSFFSPSAVYRPFPVVLWIGFLASVLLMCFMLKIISKLIYRNDDPLSFRGMIMYIFSSFMEQDAQSYLEILHLYSVRVLLANWLLFSLIISTAYRGKLVSLIAFPALTWVPTTFDELAYSNYRIALNVFGKGGATYSVLSTSKSPIYQTFFQRMELYPDPVDCLKAAFQNELGCLMVKSVADFYGAKNFTDKSGRNPFQASDQTALFREDGYIWEKRAIFRKHFDKVTWSIRETGLASFWFHQDLDNVKKKRLDWEKLNPVNNSSFKISKENDGPSKLQVVHLLGLFYLYVGGHGAGIICILFEKVKVAYLKKEALKLRRR